MSCGTGDGRSQRFRAAAEDAPRSPTRHAQPPSIAAASASDLPTNASSGAASALQATAASEPPRFGIAFSFVFWLVFVHPAIDAPATIAATIEIRFFMRVSLSGA
ncbi:hypothetical protein [Burkholderia ubonensis]|uniref:hypothetical protein n=1 Tax=Burkholderia ubonensis TaxID=101571 RepID=UPI0012F7767F|nr:hypothetical protein [Burkholderia ubonensis]